MRLPICTNRTDGLVACAITTKATLNRTDLNINFPLEAVPSTDWEHHLHPGDYFPEHMGRNRRNLAHVGENDRGEGAEVEVTRRRREVGHIDHRHRETQSSTRTKARPNSIPVPEQWCSPSKAAFTPIF